MSDIQTDITASFGNKVRKRHDRVDDLRDRARKFAVRWREVFGRHDTPVPVDDAWHHTEIALRKIQSDQAEKHLEMASDHLDAARWMIEDATNGGSTSSE